jgi:hypothetical protein
MASPKSRTIKPEKTESYDDIQEQVRLRAYELYEQRGREDGHDVEDWLQAELELLPPGVKRQLDPHGAKLVAA